jgi:antitoxin component of MazEF toxin-antitoxin module
MDIFGASIVETLDTKGTDGSNTHLGGPETITGYFGGVGQPNEHAIAWVEEYLDYYTKFGIRQVLNVNAGTIFLAYMLHKLGVDIEFKISVYMGTDNPFSTLWTMLAARLFSRDDGTTSLVGLNFANSVNNDTIEKAAALRKALGLEEDVRFEHHIVETWKSIVVQPYDRRAELVELAAKVKNISAKHEGGDLDVEKELDHPSDILDYFLPKKEVVEQGLMDALERNYIEKHNAVNHTARALTEAGLSFVAARNLHR